MTRLAASARIPLEAGVLGLLVGLLVVAPWIVGSSNGEYLLLTDWVSGPHATVSPGMYGLADEALDAMPWRIGVQGLRMVVGPAPAGWLLALLPFPLAAAGAAHLVRGGRLASYAAALVVTVSPLVIDRTLTGHVPFLVGIALLPWLVASARHARTQRRWFSARTAGWLALAVSVSPHMAWIGGVALLIVALVPVPTWRDLVRLALVVVAAAGVYAYAVAVLVAGLPTVSVGGADLTAFATRSDGVGGLFGNALTLRGFWRDSTDYVATQAGWWGLLLAVVFLAVVAAGIVLLWRSGSTRGPLALAFVVTGVVLTMGTQGPLGGAYRLAFEHLPLFEAMREPQKWAALTQLGFAIALAGAVQGLVDRAPDRAWARPSALAAAALPLALLPLLAWGVGGSVETSRYPADWQAAAEVIGDEQTLFLPWHGYQPFTFTDGRSVATPGGAFFSAPVLSSASVELGPLRTNSTSERQRFLDEVIATAGSPTFGADLADLGLRYIVVATDAQSREDYSWVADQPGVELVTATPGMTVYRVVPLPPGAARLSPAGPVAFDIAAGDPGTVVLPVECSPGWQIDGRSGVCTEQGTVAFEVGSGPARVEYVPWGLIKPGLLISVAMLLVLVVAGLVEHAADLRGRRR